MDHNVRKGRVILTYGRSLMALTAAQSLGKRGIEVIGCDDVDATVLGFSRYCEDYFVHAPYRCDVEQYLSDMEENIRKFKPDNNRPYILMPMFRDAPLLAEHKERFEGLIEIAAPEAASIKPVATKDVFAKTCDRLDLSAPKTIKTKNIDELESCKDDISFPVLIKPYDDVGGRGIHKVESFTELKKRYQENTEHYNQPPLVQEVIEGQDYCLAAICDQGEIVSAMAYKNLHSFPRESGAGIMRETIDTDPFQAIAAQLLKALKWHGVVQIDFRWSGEENDPPRLIEVNPRFWSGLFHSVESGADFPWLLYQLFAEGQITDQSDIKIGFKTRMPALWRLSAMQDIVDSELDFSQLKLAWQKLWDKESDESFQKRLGALASGLKDSVDSEDIKTKIKEMNKSGKLAKSEFDVEDDPFVGLGLLFIASSLIRHGELPPEVKH